MTAREIAEKYVYGKHNALTDKQEVEDMIKDIAEYSKAINENSVIPDVSLSCYLFKVDGEDCFVLGENIADAIDRLEKEEPNAEYELVHSKSLDCIY